MNQNNYIGNEQLWRMLIEIDWLGQYVKAWIAFNAWYRNTFPNLRDEWKIIDAIKNDDGNICSKIENFLLQNSPSQKSFQSDLADLHRLLADNIIQSKGRRIYFTSIEDYKHAKDVAETINKILYKIEINPTTKQRIVTVTNSKGRVILNKTIGIQEERNGLNDRWFTDLSTAQKKTLEGLLKDSTPIHDLIHSGSTYSDSTPLEIGNFKFINNPNLIARAIIETLYQLRNTLFHGEITPDSAT